MERPLPEGTAPWSGPYPKVPRRGAAPTRRYRAVERPPTRRYRAAERPPPEGTAPRSGPHPKVPRRGAAPHPKVPRRGAAPSRGACTAVQGQRASLVEFSEAESWCRGNASGGVGVPDADLFSDPAPPWIPEMPRNLYLTARSRPPRSRVPIHIEARRARLLQNACTTQLPCPLPKGCA